MPEKGHLEQYFEEAATLHEQGETGRAVERMSALYCSGADHDTQMRAWTLFNEYKQSMQIAPTPLRIPSAQFGTAKPIGKEMRLSEITGNGNQHATRVRKKRILQDDIDEHTEIDFPAKLDTAVCTYLQVGKLQPVPIPPQVRAILKQIGHSLSNLAYEQPSSTAFETLNVAKRTIQQYPMGEEVFQAVLDYAYVSGMITKDNSATLSGDLQEGRNWTIHELTSGED